MIYVISKSTCGRYDVRDIQCNANWDCCPYSDYALIPESMVDGILATQGYCDITLNGDGTVVTGFTARSIPTVPEECCGTNTVLSVNGVPADRDGEVTLTPNDVGAAPAGYGLGSEAPVNVGSADNALNTGWYIVKDPVSGAGTGWLYCSSYSSDYKRQEFYNIKSLNDHVHIVRYMFNGTWSEWEWVNLPMQSGVEYRTTERWNGKAVYTKLVDFGAFNGNTPKDFSVGTTADIGVPFRWNGVATNPDGIPYQIPSHKINAGMYFYATGGVTYIYFSIQPQSIGDITLNGKLQIWYTKD